MSMSYPNNKNVRGKSLSSKRLTNNRGEDEYNINKRSQSLNKFSNHLPADKQKLKSTQICQDKEERLDDGITTGQIKTPTSTSQIDYFRLDRRIDEQERRRDSLKTELISKIESVKSDLIGRGDDLRKELEEKITKAKSDNRNHIHWIIGIIFAIVSILLTLIGWSIISRINNNSSDIQKINNENTNIKFDLERIKSYLDYSTKDSVSAK